MKHWVLFDGIASWLQKAWLWNLCVSLERKQVTAEVVGEGPQEEVAEVFWYILPLTCAWLSGFHERFSEEWLVRMSRYMRTRQGRGARRLMLISAMENSDL